MACTMLCVGLCHFMCHAVLFLLQTISWRIKVVPNFKCLLLSFHFSIIYLSFFSIFRTGGHHKSSLNNNSNRKPDIVHHLSSVPVTTSEVERDSDEEVRDVIIFILFSDFSWGSLFCSVCVNVYCCNSDSEEYEDDFSDFESMWVWLCCLVYFKYLHAQSLCTKSA